MGEKPRYSIGTWKPGVVEDFLTVHGFEYYSRNGDEVCWLKRDDEEDLLVSFSETRYQLTPGTMRDSVMAQSGYTKNHWDRWSKLRKTDRKRGRCCTG